MRRAGRRTRHNKKPGMKPGGIWRSFRATDSGRGEVGSVQARVLDGLAFEYESARTGQFLAVRRRRRIEASHWRHVANEQSAHVCGRPHGGGPCKHLQHILLLQHFMRSTASDISISVGMVIMW
jgi:hypothetical protein